MKTYRVYGIVTGTKFLGEFTAENEQDAIEQALESNENYVSLCHHCAAGFDLDEYGCATGTAEEV